MPEFILRNRLKIARAEKNLSQTVLAELSGVTRQTIGAIESGQFSPSTKLALILAAVLDKKVEELFFLEKEEG